jgi:uncharacterized membrane protein YhaH (DUF805 family)
MIGTFLKFCFDPRMGPVGQKSYATTGFGLMLLKYCVDAGVIWLFSKELINPAAYLSPMLTVKKMLYELPNVVLLGLSMWTILFVWIGVNLTLRRLQDAGKKSWLTLLFFVPFINYLAMLIFAVLPTNQQAPESTAVAEPTETVNSAIIAACIGVCVGGLISVLMVFLTVLHFGDYGGTLFVGTPFVMGFVSSSIFNRKTIKTKKWNAIVAVLTMLVGASLLLLFALEGVLCLAMASPLVLVLVLLGAFAAWSLASNQSFPPAAMLLLALPFMAIVEPEWSIPLREVETKIIIDASPEKVWENVIGFSELPEPAKWFFELGIAYPKRAILEGSGVGAIRYCEFSTGPFVEPITVWDPPKRLGFSVQSQPPTMEEWSPYQLVHAPHITEGLESKRGEFRIIPLENGQTLLEGSTWYILDMHPQLYWGLWGDQLIHAIHKRVLNHIKDSSES